MFVLLQVVQIVLWYLDSGCSRHMTGDRSKLINYVEKLIGTVRFENDQFAKIIGLFGFASQTVTQVIVCGGESVYANSLCRSHGHTIVDSFVETSKDPQYITMNLNTISVLVYGHLVLRTASNRESITSVLEEHLPRAGKPVKKAPTERYGEAIVIPETLMENFEIKTNLLQDVPNDAIMLMLFPYSLEGAARIWYEKEPPNSILTWDDLEMLRACPHHRFSELTQIDTFYNGLTEQDQDTLNVASGGNVLNKTAREVLKIIENKSKVRYSRSKSNVSRVNTNSRDVVSKTDDRIDKLADQISNLFEIVNKQVIAPAKAVKKTCVTCGGAHAYYDYIATDSNQPSVCAATGSYNQVSWPNQASHQIPPPGFSPNQPSTSGTLLSNNVPNPKGEMKAVTTCSGLAYEGPSIPTSSPLEKVDEQNTEEILDKEHSNSSGSTAQVQPPVVPISILEPNVLRTQSKPTIPYPSSFKDALLLMPKFASTIKSLLANKDKLFELAKVSLNENCSAVLLKKLPVKLEDSVNMASLADKAISLGADNRPPMLEKDMYDSWKSRMELYMLNR
nr:hypothetical protein [Tanacetum cinerariifolium]